LRRAGAGGAALLLQARSAHQRWWLLLALGGGQINPARAAFVAVSTVRLKTDEVWGMFARLQGSGSLREGWGPCKGKAEQKGRVKYRKQSPDY
jgi:hypothetical protein